MGADPNYSERPGVAVISIKTSSQTPYHAYIGVLDEVWMGYFSIWDSEARTKGVVDYKAYLDVIGEGDNEIREKFPAAISIAEPDDAT